MSVMCHTSCNGIMKKYKNGLRCTKCGYTLKHKEVNNAYMMGKLEITIPEGPADTNIHGAGVNV